jgi:hypothetical protein
VRQGHGAFPATLPHCGPLDYGSYCVLSGVSGKLQPIS